MKENKYYPSCKRKCDWGKNPVGKFLPVSYLYVMKFFGTDEFPCSEYVYFHCPDGSGIIEAQGYIQKQENKGIVRHSIAF